MNKATNNMKIVLLLPLMIALFISVSCSDSAQKPATEKSMVIWYNKPAGQVWHDGLLIGNGYMGANVFGRIENERIALNESTFWGGRPHDHNDPDAYKYFDQIKELVFAEKFKAAEKLVDEHFYGRPTALQAYAPLGDLLLNFKVTGDSIKNYYRELDLGTGIVKVSYTEGDVKYTREVFMSYPDHVMVMKVSADKPGRVSVEAKLTSPLREQTTTNNNRLTINGVWRYLPKTVNWLVAKVEGTGLRFQTDIVALPEKGTLLATDSSLIVTDANSVTFVLTAATSYVNYTDISGDPGAACDKILAGVDGKNYTTLKNTHVNDFSNLMGRVHLNIGDPLMNERPTDERLADIKKGLRDPELLAKIFQFGRYMLVSSSRSGSEPANLQARWNQELLGNWGSKYTLNINTEMNYWPAEVTNLSECHMPLFDMIKDLAENGSKTAKLYYNADGWVTHHNTDLWRATAPVDAARYGMWPVGGSWLCRHLWEHYVYTGNIEFLREYYPIMKGSAQFLMDIMVEHPKYKWLVIPFSMSPEQGYYVSEGAEECFLSPSTTMDIGIIRDLFSHCIEAGKILNVDKEFGDQLEKALEEIPPYQIGKDGRLQTWIEDWIRGNESHNESLMYGFYPGNSITLRGNPELSAALEKWLDPRPARNWFNSTWDICSWARLENGLRADSVMRGVLRTRSPRGGLGNNLHNSVSNQSDLNFGLTASIAECLLQSHAGEISLLPAIPVTWENGSVTGLKARGGFEVNMEWKERKLVKAEIKSLLGNPCIVRANGKTAEYTPAKGETIVINGI